MSTVDKIRHKLTELDNGVEFVGRDEERGGTYCIFRCVCGDLWSACHTRVTKGRVCRKCSGLRRRLTSDQINDQLRPRKLCFNGRNEQDIKTGHFSCENNHTWEANIFSVVHGGNGCPHCSGKAKKTLEEVKARLEAKNLRMLSDEYIGVKHKHRIGCNTCDYEWSVTIGGVLGNKGCPKCSNRLKISVEDTKVELEKLGITVLSNDYIEKDRLLVQCKYGHQWEASRHNLVNHGRGCPICCTAGFKYDIPATLYYLVVKHCGQTLYKIGVTNRTVSERFCNTDLDKITVLRTLEFDTGQKAFDLEQYYLHLFQDCRYKGEDVLKSGGNTELFTNDILGLDTLNQKPL